MDALNRHGFLDSSSGETLQGLLHLAAAFCGTPLLLSLTDHEEVWYRCSSGLSREQRSDLETLSSPTISREAKEFWINKQKYWVLALVLIEDPQQQAIGTLMAVSPLRITLSPDQHAGLELLLVQIKALLASKQRQVERRKVPRSPIAASFVPGLAHELRNFIFGISANLDILHARFEGQSEVGGFEATLRKSLNRLEAFVSELQEFGDPQASPPSEQRLEPLLREAIEFHHPLAEKNRISPLLKIEGPLPPIKVDAQSIRNAFIRLLGLVLHFETGDGPISIQASARQENGRHLIVGHIDGPGVAAQGIDLERLFEPFYFRTAGLGRLALPVARRIFEAHDGYLAAVSRPEGGIRITFMLPATQNGISEADVHP